MLIRPESCSVKTLRKLTSAGFEVVHNPVMRLQINEFMTRAHVDVIIISSQNAIPALEDVLLKHPKAKIIAIGDYTASLCSKKVCASFESSKQFLLNYKKHFSPTDKITYLSASDVSIDIACELRKLGFDVERVICYTMQQIDHSYDVQADVVLLYSKRSAECFENIRIDQMVAICISQEVANIAKLKNFKNIITASSANEDSMLLSLSTLILS